MHRTIALSGCLLSLIILLGIQEQASGQQKKPAKPKTRPAGKSPLQAIQDKPDLPRVLLIGDSISIGYTVPVRNLMKDKANVHRAPTNCGPTTKGLKELSKWIGDKPWDVIHFNWGLHDLKYMGPQGQNLADPKAADSHQQVPPAEYEKNLRQLVAQLKKTKATLIWCNTTPVPVGVKGRVVGDSEKYNAIAAKIMKAEGIMTDDLYGFCKPQLTKIQRPANVHFTPTGSQALAKQVAGHIDKALHSGAKK